MAFRSIIGRIPGVKALARRIADHEVGDRKVVFHPSYNQDNLATDHWLTTNPAFEAAYEKAMRAGIALSAETKWRVRVVCWAAEVGAKLGGAFVECGVAKGFMSRVVLDYLNVKEPFYLLDTYNGFDERYLSPEQAAGLKAWAAQHGGNYYQDSYEQVVATFSDAPNVRVIRGAVPDTLLQVDAERIAYLSIDMNAAIPEIAAIEYFWPKLAPGAFVVLDDYGWRGHEEQRHAFDRWAERTGAALLSLPTGQGLIVKA